MATKLVPHVHAELIKAWAEGHIIQMFYGGGVGWVDDAQPDWDTPSEKLRIKPAEPVYEWQWILKLRGGSYTLTEGYYTSKEQVEKTVIGQFEVHEKLGVSKRERK